MAIRTYKKISQLNSIASASLSTYLAGVDNGQTVRVTLDVLADSVKDRINTLDDQRLDILENLTGSFAITGSNSFYGNQFFSGSLIPFVGDGTLTSSFSLGDAEHAWQDIWVSKGTIRFIGQEGEIRDTLSATEDGLAMTNLLVNGGVTTNLTINPQSLTSNITVPEYHNGLLVGPIATNYDIVVKTGGILTII